MKRPGKPREIGKSFESLVWDKGRIRFVNVDDVLKAAYEPINLSMFIPEKSIFDLLVPRVGLEKPHVGVALGLGLTQPKAPVKGVQNGLGDSEIAVFRESAPSVTVNTECALGCVNKRAEK